MSKQSSKNWKVGFRSCLYLISLFIIFQFVVIGFSFMFGNIFGSNVKVYPVIGFLILVSSGFLFIYSLGWALRDLYKRLK